MAELSKARYESIEQNIKKAEIAPLQATLSNDGPMGPVEIAEGVLNGTIPPEQVDDLLLRWIAGSVDVPYVPDALERKALETVVEALEAVVLSIIKSKIR